MNRPVVGACPVLATTLLMAACLSVPEFRGGDDDGGGDGDGAPLGCDALDWKQVGPSHWPCYAEVLTETKNNNVESALSVRAIDYTYGGGTSCQGTFGWWAGGVVAENGKIYAMPHCAREILVIDPGGSPEVSYIGGAEITAAEPSFSGTDNRWVGGVLAHDGMIYAMPRSSNMLLRINPETDEVLLSDVTTIDSVEAYGSVLAPDGIVWAIPEDGQQVAFFDPSNGSEGIVVIDGKAQAGGWRGGVLGPDGLIYGIPGPGYDRVLVIDPAQRVATLGPQTPGSGWSGGTPTSSGEMVFVPNEATDALRFAPGGELVTIAVPESQGGTDAWQAAAYLADGRVLGGIDSDGRILEISDGSSRAALELGASSGVGLVHGLNGKIYSIPYRGDAIYEISAGVGQLPDDIVLSAYFNKF